MPAVSSSLTAGIGIGLSALELYRRNARVWHWVALQMLSMSLRVERAF